MFYGEQKKKKCIGTYRVSGYTREDGTKVSSYMRMCGAKHEGKDTAEKVKEEYTLTDDEREYVRKKEYLEQINNLTFASVQDSLTDGVALSLQQYIAKHVSLPYVFCEYYNLSLDYDKRYNNKNNVYKNFEDINESKLKEFIKKEYENEKISNSTPVVIVQPGSPLANELIINSDKLFNEINNHIIKIKLGVCKNNNFSFSFNANQDTNLYLTLGKCNVYNLKYDKGIYSGAVVDYYDFSWLKHSPNLKQAIFNAVNNNAVIQQCNGELTPYIIIIPFIIYEN